MRRGAPGRGQGNAADGVAPNGPVAAAVGASHRLPCAARPGVVRRNSLRSLRELRSDRAPQVRSTKRASRAAPEAALLGAADTGPLGATPSAALPCPRPGAPLRTAPPRCHLPRWRRRWCLQRRRRRSSHEPPLRLQRRRPAAAGAPCAQPRSAAAPAARAARIVHHSRGDCPSGARAASAASFAAPAGAASIAGHPRVAGASTRRACGRQGQRLAGHRACASPAPAPRPAPSHTQPFRGVDPWH